MEYNVENKVKKKKMYTRYDRALIGSSFLVGTLAVCECIALLDGAFEQVWEDMGVNGYAGRLLVCMIMISSFIYLAQTAFNDKPFNDMFTAGMTMNGILCVMASAVFCYLPGYQREWFSWELSSHVTIDGYYLLLGIILIVVGHTVKYAVEEAK